MLIQIKQTMRAMAQRNCTCSNPACSGIRCLKLQSLSAKSH